MNKLDPNVLFARIVTDIPAELHEYLFVTGSLAAAYHFQAQLEGRAVNTKDADLVVHPAGNVTSCRGMAEKLLGAGWVRTEDCYPRPTPQPEDELRAIRLYPPNSHDYFIEFLNLPDRDQQIPKRWLPIELSDGWYGLPSFRFMALTSVGRLRSESGLEYAAPPMMALSNMLSHPEIGTARIESGAMKGILRSAKDLGRVLALAVLAGRDGTAAWVEQWMVGLQQCFPDEWKLLAAQAGHGLRDLLGDEAALDEARVTTDIGLLSGRSTTSEQLRIAGERLLVDVIEPLEQAAS